MFDHNSYIQQYLDNAAAGNSPINDAEEKYGVLIEPSSVSPGTGHWKIIGIHHLTPDENNGKQNFYLHALFENGDPAEGFWVGWQWEGMTPGQNADPVRLDKPPAQEPMGNIALWGGMKVDAWMLGMSSVNNEASDKVLKVHTGHPDEGEGNTWGHHSFFAVWQWTIKNIVSASPSSSVSASPSLSLSESPPVSPSPSLAPMPKPLKSYVLLWDVNREELLVISKLLNEKRLTSGFDVNEAMLAEEVIVYGELSSEQLKTLEDSGSIVELRSVKCDLIKEIEWLIG
jgi:hypothetical protein